MNLSTQITASLEALFSELDAEVLTASQEWAKGRVSAIREFKASDEAKALQAKGAYGGYYPRLFAVAGGKTWYNIFDGRSASMIEEFMVKNCKAIADKRNASITAKMIKAGATSVDGQEFARSADGFNGTFVLNTDTGRKVVTIDTIRAGGYNIQCLHLRVLVKVR